MELLIKFLATYLLLIIILLTLYILRKRIKESLLLGLASYGLAEVINTIIRGIYFVPRPYITDHETPLVIFPPKDSSFPSGHAITVFLLATLVYSHNKKWGMLFYILASLVGIGRVMALVHYPVDILGGAILGVGSVFIVNRLFRNRQTSSNN